MARPTKFTETVATRILESLKKGAMLGEAAAVASISLRTLQNWLAEGRAAKSGKKKEFAENVEIARGVGIAYLVKKLDEYAEETKAWRAMAWRLERIAPSEFALNSQAFAKRVEEEERYFGDTVERTDAESIDDEVRRFVYGPVTQQGEGNGEQKNGQPSFAGSCTGTTMVR